MTTSDTLQDAYDKGTTTLPVFLSSEELRTIIFALGTLYGTYDTLNQKLQSALGELG